MGSLIEVQETLKQACQEEEANWKRVYSVQGSDEHNLGQTAQTVKYVKVRISLASSSCNTAVVISIKET